MAEPIQGNKIAPVVREFRGPLDLQDKNEVFKEQINDLLKKGHTAHAAGDKEAAKKAFSEVKDVFARGPRQGLTLASNDYDKIAKDIAQLGVKVIPDQSTFIAKANPASQLAFQQTKVAADGPITAGAQDVSADGKGSAVTIGAYQRQRGPIPEGPGASAAVVGETVEAKKAETQLLDKHLADFGITPEQLKNSDTEFKGLNKHLLAVNANLETLQDPTVSDREIEDVAKMFSEKLGIRNFDGLTPSLIREEAGKLKEADLKQYVASLFVGQKLINQKLPQAEIDQYTNAVIVFGHDHGINKNQELIELDPSPVIAAAPTDAGVTTASVVSEAEVEAQQATVATSLAIKEPASASDAYLDGYLKKYGLDLTSSESTGHPQLDKYLSFVTKNLALLQNPKSSDKDLLAVAKKFKNVQFFNFQGLDAKEIRAEAKKMNAGEMRKYVSYVYVNTLVQQSSITEAAKNNYSNQLADYAEARGISYQSKAGAVSAPSSASPSVVTASVMPQEPKPEASINGAVGKTVSSAKTPTEDSTETLFNRLLGLNEKQHADTGEVRLNQAQIYSIAHDPQTLALFGITAGPNAKTGDIVKLLGQLYNAARAFEMDRKESKGQRWYDEDNTISTQGYLKKAQSISVEAGIKVEARLLNYIESGNTQIADARAAKLARIEALGLRVEPA